MTYGGSVEPREAGPDWERDRPSQRWWQGSDGYWYPPTADRGAPRSALMMASSRLSPAARADQDGGGAPPSPPSTPSSAGGRGTRGAGGPHGFASEEEAKAEEQASRFRHPTARPFGLWEGDLGRARRRVAALAPWASSRSARSGPTLGMQAGDDGAEQAALRDADEGSRALPLWLCIGVPLVIVLLAFVAIAVFTAPTGTDTLPSGPRVVTDAGGGRPLPTAGPVATTAATAPTTTTTAPTTTSTTDEPEATDATAPATSAPPTTADAAGPAGAPPAAGARGAASPEPQVGVLPLVEAVTGRGCHPSYAPCVPRASDVDCKGEGDGPEHVRHVRVIGPDEYELDPDGNGVGCD